MKIIITKTDSEIAELVATKIIALVVKNPATILGLATGSSPIKTYKQIIEKAKKDAISFTRVKSFNLDEYCGCNDVTQTYRYFMETNLFAGIGINRANTFFPSEENKDGYDSLIASHGGVDLQLLGIGSNGHIAFNEPGTNFEEGTHIVNLTQKTIQDNARFFAKIEDVPTQAITSGLATIMNAKEIVLIATGENKKEAVYQMIEGEITPSCPATILRNHHNVTVYLDEAAASLLKERRINEKSKNS